MGKRNKFSVGWCVGGEGEAWGWFCGKDDVLCLKQEWDHSVGMSCRQEAGDEKKGLD